MLEVKIDDTELLELARDLPQANRAALVSAMRSETYRLHQAFRAYAGSASFGPFSPLTIALRKRKGGYGPWIRQFAAYHVDPQQLGAALGVLSREDVDLGAARFRPVSRGFAAAARRLAGGYQKTITRKQQRGIAKVLMQRYQTDAYHAWVPRVGTRTVRARPIARVVFEQERARSIRNIRELFRIKIAGGRWSLDWASEWGNA